MNQKNYIEIEGTITSELKHDMIGAKKNYATVFFMLKNEQEPVTKKDGTKFTPGVKVAISAGGKLAEACKSFKPGDLVAITGMFRIDSKDRPDGLGKNYFPKIEAATIEKMVVAQPHIDNDFELPF